MEEGEGALVHYFYYFMATLTFFSPFVPISPLKCAIIQSDLKFFIPESLAVSAHIEKHNKQQ